MCRAFRVAAAVLLPFACMHAQDRTPLAQPRMVAQGADAGALPDSQAAPSLTITLKRTAAQQGLLDTFLKNVRTAGATNYHAWLTPSAFAANFAPAPDAVTAWLQTQGLQIQSVSAGGMRIMVSGTVAQANAAFGVSMHRLTTLTGEAISLKGTPSVPSALGGLVVSVSGWDGAADAITALEGAVDANAVTVVPADLRASTASADEWNAVLEQAAAQGQTVVLSHVAHALLPAHALVLRTADETASSDADAVTTPRPEWQVAPGLPTDNLRATPDATAETVAAVVAGLQSVAVKNGRQGEIAARIYAVAPEEGVFTHADATALAGSWTKVDGLGMINVAALVKALAVGSTAPLNSSIALSTRNLTHGQPLTLTATITGGSGTPTGTVTFGSAQGGTLGTATLSNGVATYTTSLLDGGQYGLYGTYNGDSTYAVSTTNVDTATVQPEAASIAATAGGTPSVGTTIPVAITVSSPSGVGTPSGNVTVYPYGTAIATSTFTGTLSPNTMGSASATVTVPATNQGTFQFQVNCTASANFSCSSPQAISVTVAKGTPVFSLAMTGTASSATLTATATPPSGSATGTVAPTGSVQFLDNGTAIGNALLDSTGKSTYTGPLGNGTTHAVTANYIGDGNYSAATAAANASTTKVTPSVALSVVTAASSLSATVTPPSGTATVPTGTVQFLLGTTAFGSGTVNASGVATYSGTYGSGILTAVYSGDTNFNTATSNAIDTTKVTPTVTLTKTSTAASSTVSLSAAVTSTSTKTATGSVTFLDGTTSIGTGSLSTAGVATFSGALAAQVRAGVSPLASTTHTLTAVYAGDTNFNTATSNAVTATAATTLITTMTSLTSSSGYSGTFGTSFTFNVVVTPASYISSGAGPTGSVTISDASGVVGTGSVTNGSAMVTISTLSVGTHALTATYGGDTNYATSTSSPAVTVTIAAVTATVTATVTPTGSVPYGYDANLNITVTATSGTNGPAGTVTATINGSTYSATLSATTGSLVSTASLSFPVPPPGTYTITIACGSGLTCTNAATAKITTTKGYTKTTLNAGSTSPQAGIGTTLTATVANTGTGSGTYTYGGTVTFYAGNKVLGTATVANGTATATVIYTSASAQSVYAVYSGDTNWNGSTSDPTTVTPLPIQPVIGVSANTLNGIVSQNITLTASVSSGLNTVKLVPSGQVTFYDTYNGVIVNLGSVALLSNGLNTAYGTLSTTGLQAGSHSIFAIYAGDSLFTTVTSANILVNMGDFSLSFVPTMPVVAQGSSATVTVLVGSLNGFTGTVALGCTPPGGTLTTCSVTPNAVSAGSSAVLTIGTTKSTAKSLPGSTVAFGAIAGFGAMCLAGMRRYRVASVLVLLLTVVLMSGGCTQVAATGDSGGNTGSGGTANNGTPLGTLSFTVTGAAVDAPIAARHSNAVQVTVQ